MHKKTISIIMLFVFISFTFSCASLREINLEKGQSYNQNSKVIAVFTKSGDLFEFPGKNPAMLTRDAIHGMATDKSGKQTAVSIPLKEAKVIWIQTRSYKFILTLPLAIFGVWCTYRIIDYVKIESAGY